MRYSIALVAIAAILVVTPVLGQGGSYGFNMILEPAAIAYEPSIGTGSGSVGIDLVQNLSPGVVPVTVQGFSLALSHDVSFLTVASVEPGAHLQSFGPDFFQPTLVAGGFTVGCVYSYIGAEDFTYEIQQELAIVTYNTVPASLVGDIDGAEAALTWTMSPGDSTGAVLTAGTAIAAMTTDGSVTLTAIRFRRGDCNADALFDVADPIALLGALFVAGTVGPGCPDACDVNDDGLVNIADAVYSLSALFSPGSPPPVAPHPDCGSDSTADGLGCSPAPCL
ncbi:MAG: hypothetical protein ACKVX7_07950 [Planctomycetota bacterium]